VIGIGPVAESNLNFLDRHYFLLRRLHSLTGVVPIGVFLVFHLTTNASIVWAELIGREGGVATFKHEVAFIHSLPFLILIEIFGLWLPIAFHAVLGIYYAVSGKVNVQHYGYQDNWRYALQRISGYVGVIYIFYHVATLRWGWTWLPGAAVFDPSAAASSTALALRGGVEEVTWRLYAITAFYLVSVALLVFHFANGLWTAALTWGLTISEQAQARWGYVCTALGVALMVLGIAAVFGFATLDIEEARMIEAELDAAHTSEIEETAAESTESELPSFGLPSAAAERRFVVNEEPSHA
jgi:succinate dehydrogenase / fumarate reductase cytochrome b subunit